MKIPHSSMTEQKRSTSRGSIEVKGGLRLLHSHQNKTRNAGTQITRPSTGRLLARIVAHSASNNASRGRTKCLMRGRAPSTSDPPTAGTAPSFFLSDDVLVVVTAVAKRLCPCVAG
jgi:hypothetical protein